MANERISVEKANHVATLTLNRPAKHNAFDGLALAGVRPVHGRTQS